MLKSPLIEPDSVSNDKNLPFDSKTYDPKILSFSVSTELINSTISENESLSASDNNRIESILPFSISILEFNDPVSNSNNSILPSNAVNLSFCWVLTLLFDEVYVLKYSRCSCNSKSVAKSLSKDDENNSKTFNRPIKLPVRFTSSSTDDETGDMDDVY